MNTYNDTEAADSQRASKGAPVTVPVVDTDRGTIYPVAAGDAPLLRSVDAHAEDPKQEHKSEDDIGRKLGNNPNFEELHIAKRKRLGMVWER